MESEKNHLRSKIYWMCIGIVVRKEERQTDSKMKKKTRMDRVKNDREKG